MIKAYRFCQRCNKFIMALLARNITASGVSQVYWYCEIGKHRLEKPGQSISHKKVLDANIEINSLPVIENYTGNDVCVVCGDPATELHHIAPRHLFKDDADNWPTVYLCKKHHDEWHRRVTPGMYKGSQDVCQDSDK